MSNFIPVKLLGKFVVNAKLEIVTGLHIGTAKDTIKIGDIDNPVIKDINGIPYIPGSSLKGKMRSLMEFYHGKLTPDLVIYVKKKEKNQGENIRMHMCDEKDCPVCNLFGRNHGEHEFVNNEDEKKESNSIDDEKKESNNRKKKFSNIIPTRLIVRDAHLIVDDNTKDYTEYTEVKFENNIDRITSAANPRQTERVPVGTKFGVEFIVNRFMVEGEDDKEKYLNELIKAMRLLEDDYLGGQGSRGYGKVKFKNIKIEYRDVKYYSGKVDTKQEIFDTLDEITPEKIKSISGGN